MLSANVDVLTEGKLAELQAFLDGSRVDLLALSEVYPKSGGGAEVLRSCLALRGYEVEWPESRGGRGVVIFVRTGVRYSTFRLPDTSSAVAVRLVLRGSSLVVVSWYRSPTSSFEDCASLAACVECVCSAGCPAVFLGDLNLPGVDWVLGTGDCPLVARTVLRAIQLACLEQVVEGTTRARQCCRPSLLDVVLVTSSSLVRNVSRRSPLGKSDHGMVVVEVAVGVCSGLSRSPGYVWGRGDWEEVSAALLRVDWIRQLDDRGVDGFWCYLLQVLWDAVAEFVPRASGDSPRSSPWIGPRCLRALRAKTRAWKAVRMCGSVEVWAVYRRVRARASSVVRIERARYERRLAARLSTSPRAFWGYVRSRTALRSGLPSISGPGGMSADDAGVKAAVLSEFFSSVFRAEPVGPVSAPPSPTSTGSLSYFRPPTVFEVEGALRSLRRGKAPGPDRIVPEILINCAAALARPLAILFERSLRVGVLPSQWKMAAVVPVHKGGSRSEPSSYRPISLTSTVCRVLERFLQPQLFDFFVSVGVVRDEQFGFRPGRSPCSLLLDGISAWMDAVEGDTELIVYIWISEKHLIEYRIDVCSLGFLRLVCLVWRCPG